MCVLCVVAGWASAEWEIPPMERLTSTERIVLVWQHFSFLDYKLGFVLLLILLKSP